ncbi:MAG: sigma-54 dependent transcriptional regulator [Vicinamibacterales bacterium]|nr:sigma-54 dependent transcriptional regulator [Vicinamibacterales bacterium]
MALTRLDESAVVMDGLRSLPGTCPPSLVAEIDRVEGSLFARLGDPASGSRRLERAVRVLSVVGSAGACGQARAALAQVGPLLPEESLGKTSSLNVVDAACLSDLSPNPELLGREALALIINLDCARGAALVVTRNGFPLELLAHHGWSSAEAREFVRATERKQRLPLGKLRDRSFHLTVSPKPDMASRDALGSVRTLIESALELEGFRRKERRQCSLIPFEPPDGPDGIFLSGQMLKVVAVARRIAGGDLPVLITGETGSGKEVLARLIHAASNRSEKSFVAFNCTGLPRDTAESQLFGHRRGSFTDAREDSTGIIRGADGATLMLDEIGELDPTIQPKLLRFLDSGEVQPVGEPKPVWADVRVIAATNVAIDTLVREGRFREDLFYRLNVVRLRIPPLRERREEIPPLAHHFLRRFGREMKRGHLDLSPDALTCLLLYDWPGNVRQLSNEVRRIVAMAKPDDTIRPNHLSPEILAVRDWVPNDPDGEEHSPTHPDELAIRIDQPLASAIEQLERAMIHRAIRATNGRVNSAARLLGLSRKGLFLKRRRLEITTDTGA